MKSALFLLLFCALPLFAAPGAFTIEPQGDSFRILHRGKVLVSAIHAHSREDGRFGLDPIKTAEATLPDGTRVWNRWSENPDTRIRLEVAVKGDGSEIELNMLGETVAYSADMTRTVDLILPWEALAGCDYQGLVISGRVWKTDQGTLGPDTPANARIGASPWRYLVFSKGNAAASGVVFDFHPIGAGAYSLQHATGGFRGIVHPVREGNVVRMQGGATGADGITGLKLVLREGDFATDYPTHHAWRSYTYNDRVPTQRLYSFGSARHGKEYTAADTAAFTPQRGYGWLNAPQLKPHRDAPEGALYSALQGKDAAFRIGGLPPGLHLLHISSGNYGGARNSFGITVNGREVLPRQSVARRELLDVGVPVWTTDGTIEIRFDGDFLVSAIGTAFLMAEAEDFTYQRGYWRVDGFEPASYLHNSDHNPQAPLTIDVARIPMPVPGEEDKGPLKPLRKEIELPDPDDPELAWIKKVSIGGVHYNYRTHDDAREAALLQRRLDEVQAEGANTVMIGVPPLSRHTYPNQIPRDHAKIARLVQAAHARGMKVIDHNDATLLWQAGIGFRQCAERLNECIRAFPDMMPTPAFCLNNPVFTEKYTDFILDVLRRGVDGLQCDETYFYPYFCGCRHCRAAFHADTGWWLPLNELDPRLKNPRAPLWKAFIEWRKSKAADWVIGLRRKARTVNPHVLICRYNTHGGFTTTSAPYQKGNDLIEFTRVVNFLGTEVMPRNCLVCARALIPFRKVFNLLREATHIPIWAWLYGAHPDARYFAWAACNIAAGTGFIHSKPGEDNYLAFRTHPDNMDIALARPTAQIVLLFSQHSRDWNTRVSMSFHNLGIAQTLEELHIPYRVFAEFSLTPEKLKGMKAIIVGASACLSDRDIEAIRAFARQGGTVLLGCNAATCNELGIPREKWPFQKEFRLRPRERHIKGLIVSAAAGRDGAPVKLLKPLAYFGPGGKRPAAEEKPLLCGFDAEGNAYPLVYDAKFGKGRILYEAAPMGLSLFIGELGKVGGKWPYELDEALATLYRPYLGNLFGHATPWEVDAPFKVATELYRQGDALVAHFLNGQGATLKKGDTYTVNPPGESWPPLQKDIQFTLNASGVKTVYAVSPDFKGHQPVPFTRNGDSITVTLPKSLLRAYTLVWMKR